MRTIDPARGRGAMLVLALVSVVSTLVGLPPAGAETVAGSPIGHVDVVTAVPNVVRVIGWALDPDDDPDNPTHTVAVGVYLDGVLKAYDPAATEPRPDVGAAYPFGADHGFDLSFGWTPGAHQICVGAVNAPGTPGADVVLGCTTTTGTPFGNLESLELDGLVATISGWAIDPDTQNGTPIAVYVDDRLVAWLTMADLQRDDLSLAYPFNGTNHGFDFSFTIPTGAVHRVCVVAQNVAGTDGRDAVLACGSVDTTPRFTGSLDFVEQTDLGLRAAGWIADIDAPLTPIPVAAFIDGELVGYVPAANGHRADVGAATPYGPEHGFDVSFFVSPGRHRLCLTSVSGAGVEGVFTCADVVKLSLK